MKTRTRNLRKKKKVIHKRIKYKQQQTAVFGSRQTNEEKKRNSEEIF